MAIANTPLGFQKPDGGEAVRNGDNVIAANADKAEQRFQEDRSRLGAIEAKNVTQDNRLTSVESKNATQDNAIASHTTRITNAENAAATLTTRVTATENKNTTQDTRLTAVETTATNLSGRMTAAESKNATQDARLNNNETAANALTGRVTATESKNTAQDGRLSAVESKNTAQDTRAAIIEAKDREQDGRLTTVEGKVTTFNSGQLVQNGRLANLEKVAGFNSPPLELSDEVVAALVSDEASTTSDTMREQYAGRDEIEGASDPLAYLNSIDILCSWDTRPVGTEATYPQGVSINEDAQEIYVANQGGTLLRIDIRNMDGTLKSSRSITTANGAYTEGMPWWYNGAGDLCFFIRTGVGATENTYNIYNYTQGTLGPQIPIQGLWKADVQGGVLVTTDARTDTISRLFVYDWESVKAGTPTLTDTIYVESSAKTAAKNQGIVVNGGYVFLTQGVANSFPTITTYNMHGRIVDVQQVSTADFAAALNTVQPGLITNVAGYAYENEAGCTYQGKLVTMDIINNNPATISTSRTVLVVHNVINGVRMPTTPNPTYTHDTGWVDLALLGTAVPYGGDTVPRIRRIGKQIFTEGAIKGITAAQTDVATIPADFLPQYNRQFTQIFGGSGQCSTWQVTASGAAPDGKLRLLGVTAGTITATSWLPMANTWLRK